MRTLVKVFYKDLRVVTYFYQVEEKDVYSVVVDIILRMRKLINGVYIQMVKHSLK